MAKKRFVLGSGKKAQKALRFLDGERVWIGVDVHKRSYTIAVWSDRRGLLRTWTQPASVTTLIDRLNVFKERIVKVVYEAGPTGFGLVRALLEAQLPAEVIAPSKTPVKRGPDGKCDRLDATKLSEYSYKELLEPVQVPTPQQEADRQVVRMRETVAKELRRDKQRIKSFLLNYGIEEPAGLGSWSRAGVEALHDMQLQMELRFSLDTLLNDLEYHQQQLARVQEKVDELAKEDLHGKEVAILRTASGVGLLTAMVYRTEMFAAEKLEDRGEVTAMCGFVPKVNQSGEQRREGPILRCGKTRVRRVLVEAAWRQLGRDPSAAERYRRLCANTGSGKQAIVGVARQLGIVLWRMLVTMEPYRQPN